MSTVERMISMKIVPALLICVLIQFGCRAGLGQSSRLTLAQRYVHTAWGEKEGAPRHIRAITQTPDGFLWMGADGGLYRFDGFNFEHYQPLSGPALPYGSVSALLALPNGDLWIGFGHGKVSLLRHDRAVNYTSPEKVLGAYVFSLAQDATGMIWAGTRGGLAKFEGDRWIAAGKDWNLPPGPVVSVFVDRQGTLWIANQNTIAFLPKGAKTFQPTSIQIGQVYQITEARNGKLWMAETTRSVRPLPLGTKTLPSDDTEVRVGSTGIIFRQDGDLWIATAGDGVCHVLDPEQLRGKPGRFDTSIERYTTKEGLTDNSATSIFQDREGNIWVGTYNGLDRFRKSSFIPIVPSPSTFWAMLVPADGGDIWIQSSSGVARVHDFTASSLAHLISSRLEILEGAYRDSSGATWWVTSTELLRSEKDRFTHFPLPEGIAQLCSSRPHQIALTMDGHGVLWMVVDQEGLFYRKADTWYRFETPPELKAQTPTTAYTDDSGRVWFGYAGGAIIYVLDGKIQTVSDGRDSPVGPVYVIGGRHQQIWIGGDFGLFFFDGEHLLPVGTSDAAKFVRVLSMEVTTDGSLWFSEQRGVIHISPEELHKFLQSPAYRVHYQLFDSFDGLPGRFEVIPDGRPREALDSKGRLWFIAKNGVASLNPASIRTASLPPPALVRGVTADGKKFPAQDNPILPALTARVVIDYSGLNLAAPERVRCRYEMEGVDKGWQDAGSIRQAIYTGLPPGKHRFRLNARNVGGEWNAQDTVMEFSIAPAWFQTVWFKTLCVGLACYMLWLFYRIRVRQVARAISVRFDERLQERTRLARDLHDTLLQTIQGSKLVADSALKQSADPASILGAMEQISVWLGRATEEGRAALNSLRTSATERNDLAEAFRRSIEECRMHGSMEGSLSLTGVVTEMHPIVRDEVYRIGYEAIRNACAHSQATQLQVELTYAEDLVLTVRDNGVGIDPGVIGKGKEGHFGLEGMRERARRIMSKLTVETSSATGTEIKLVVPGSIIYSRALHGKRKSHTIKSLLKRMGLTSDSPDA
jgi:ligand-binding sensor domain-containing protein